MKFRSSVGIVDIHDILKSAKFVLVVGHVFKRLISISVLCHVIIKQILCFQSIVEVIEIFLNRHSRSLANLADSDNALGQEVCL